MKSSVAGPKGHVFGTNLLYRSLSPENLTGRPPDRLAEAGAFPTAPSTASRSRRSSIGAAGNGHLKPFQESP
ncbi:hypothetical protein EMEDMD4_1270010 [Sinorhizobium medicae]|uniref:Uncharacterized protein n=1 Tax=Sinorhizobium medicae TaxID=110321 RepID=A0A508WRC6_9HYPH|nr:hypothetical protein EMEDMD4_1270010 [Sinorhizobium medicae]